MEIQVEEVEPLRPTRQDANSDRILRDGDEMDGYGDEGANNVMRDVCEPSDGREEACPTGTARCTSRARAQALSSDARQRQLDGIWPRRTRSSAMWMCSTTCGSVPCGQKESGAPEAVQKPCRSRSTSSASLRRLERLGACACRSRRSWTCEQRDSLNQAATGHVTPQELEDALCTSTYARRVRDDSSDEDESARRRPTKPSRSRCKCVCAFGCVPRTLV
mmetsp:Transcript_7326/g.22135  ORF Transcript_7326/g.22135 Transcript_7326/m.22135 type:complete len:220 (-) Transcript_7326:115-774(-)